MAFVPMNLGQLATPRQRQPIDIVGNMLGAQGDFRQLQQNQNQQQVLANLTDPMMRNRFLTTGEPIAPETGRKSVFAQRAKVLGTAEVQDLLKKYNLVKDRIVTKRAENPKANIANEMMELGEIESLYYNKTQQKIPSPRSIEELIRERRQLSTEEQRSFEKEKFANQEEEQAYNSAVKAFDTSISKIKDTGAQMAKVWPLLEEASKGNNASAVAAVKILTQSLDNSAVMAGEMDVLGDQSLTGQLGRFLNKQETKQSFTAKELQDIYNTGLRIAEGVNQIIGRKGANAKEVYNLRAGEYASEAGNAFDKYVNTLRVPRPSGAMPEFVMGDVAGAVSNVKPQTSTDQPATQQAPSSGGVKFTGSW